MAGTIQEKAMSLPFSVDDFGSISTTTNHAKLWADRVRSAVGTALTERLMRYEYGTEIPSALFETEEVMSETIRIEVAKAFSNFLPLLTLGDIEIDFDTFNNLITATVSYSLPNEEAGEVSVGVATISPDSSFSEVL